MINIAICDDDTIFLSIIKNEIEIELLKNKLDFHINTYDSSEKLLEKVNSINYDLLFLDIDMPNFTGIELVNNYFHQSDIGIVFVSNRDDLVFDALRCQPINFIRKQHLRDELPSVIESFFKKILISEQYYDFNVNRTIKRVQQCDILYIENKKHYVNVVCKKTDESFTTKLSMKNLEKELGNTAFFRIHIGYLVNVYYIRQFGQNCVTLENGIKLPVSRKRTEEAKKAFQMSRRYL